MSDEQSMRQAAVTVAILTTLFCGQPGIWDAFRAWSVNQLNDLPIGPGMALWAADMQQQFLPMLAADLSDLLTELHGEST